MPLAFLLRRLAPALLAASYLMPPATHAAREQQVVLATFQGVSEAQYRYFEKLLGRALAVTEAEYGKADVSLSPEPMSPKRMFAELQAPAGSVDVTVWTCSGPATAAASGTRTIDVPIDRGLLGYRLLLTTPNKLPLFRGVRRLDGLAGLRLTLGYPVSGLVGSARWAPLNLSDAPNMERAVDMLLADRFDGIIIAAREAEELMSRLDGRTQGVVIEPTLMLTDHGASCFVASAREASLAARIDKGLRRLIGNGEAARLARTEHLDSVVRRFKLAGRTVVALPTEASQRSWHSQFRQWMLPY